MLATAVAMKLSLWCIALGDKYQRAHFAHQGWMAARAAYWPLENKQDNIYWRSQRNYPAKKYQKQNGAELIRIFYMLCFGIMDCLFWNRDGACAEQPEPWSIR